MADTSTSTQFRLRNAVQNLIDTETSYVLSLKKIIEILKGITRVLSSTRSGAIKFSLEKAEEIQNIHKMFHIGLEGPLENLHRSGSIGETFNMFSRPFAVDVYSDYINSIEAAFDTIREMQNPRRTFLFARNRHRQTLRIDIAKLSSDMIKPVQRFPQLMLLLTDGILKNTPGAHHDRHALQEALTDVDNVAYQLNERKRSNDQKRNAQAIVCRFSPPISGGDTKFLIREDKMDMVYSDGPRSYMFRSVKLRLYLMNKIIAFEESQSERASQRGQSTQITWKQDLEELELTTSIRFLNNLTHLYASGKLEFAIGPCGESEDVIYELQNMMHDTKVLQGVKTEMATLQRSYKILDHVEATITSIQTEIHGKLSELLRILYHRYIILHDTNRGALLALCTESAAVKQDWCTDFLLAKYALDTVNIPSWYIQDREQHMCKHPALLMKRVSMNVHPSKTMLQIQSKVKCVVHVNVPSTNGGPAEHIWVCSSNELAGFVSIVPLHSNDSVPIQTFRVTDCNIVCAEQVPEVDVAGNPKVSVWISTTDMGILVFADTRDITEPDFQKRPLKDFPVGCTVVCLIYADRKVFCGLTTGNLLVYGRDNDGGWCICSRIQLGTGSVTSIISVGDTLWAASGSQIHVIHRRTYEVQDRISHQMDDPDLELYQMVKAGVGVWASFHRKPNIVLFHSESRQVLQILGIAQAMNKFLTECRVDDDANSSYEVTSLTASVGLLWVGTNVGITLVYPLPRLRACVPRIHQRPHVAFHGHSGTTKFLLPMIYDPVSGLAERNRPTSNPVDDDCRDSNAHGDFRNSASVNGGDKTIPTSLSGVDDNQVGDCSTGIKYQRLSYEEDYLNMASEEFEDVDFESSKQPYTRRNCPDDLADLTITGDEVNTIYPALMHDVHMDFVPDQTDNFRQIGEGLHTIYRRQEPAIDDYSHDSRSCNTILVVAGGNGYTDWRNCTNSQDDHAKDPCLLFWMYKI